MSDILAVTRWWLAVFVLGMAAAPLCAALFRKLPSQGYPYAKLFGLLLVSYLFWLFGSFGFLGNDLGGILAALFALLATSFWVARRTQWSFRAYLNQHGRLILVTELVFTVLFLAWVWVRAQHPSIINTEKPMEFAFLNAVGRSEAFPPLDPWLSGFAISYYYFGYVMMSVVARLAAIAEPVAFNIGIAWLFATTGLGAFGLIYDLVGLTKSPRAKRFGVALGLIGALALPAAGNLQILLEVAYANGIGSAETWEWLDIRDINEPLVEESTPRYEQTSWWWWRSSRVINEYHLSGRNETGLNPIHEFPGFSFILGDMHPHVLALPFAFLSMAVALAWYLGFKAETDEADREADESDAILTRILRHELLLPFLATAIVVGGLSFLNTWDFLIHLFVVVGAYALARWRQQVEWTNAIFVDGLKLFFGLLAACVVLYFPFYVGFRSQAGAPYILPMLMQPTRLAHFLVIFGMPLVAIVLMVVGLLVQQRFRHWLAGLKVAGGLILGLLALTFFMGLVIAASVEGNGPILNIANELGLNLRPMDLEAGFFGRIGYAFSVIGAIAPTLLIAKITSPWVVLLLGLLIGGSVMLTQESFMRVADDAEPTARSNALPFVLLLVLAGSLLTIGPEFVFLRDNFGQRLNTIFKFYYQAWALFGVAALVSLYILIERTRILAAVATFGYLGLFGAAMLFPFYAVQSRSAEYGGEQTLNGLAHIDQNNPDEYMAINWLREEVDGAPVTLEAVGGPYSNYARVAANTGLPTVLGWAQHEYQWRGPTPEPAERDPVVETIYSQTTWEGIPALLDQYDITYVYVGNLERQTYGDNGLQKLAENMEVAFQNDTVTIYAWKPN